MAPATTATRRTGWTADGRSTGSISPNLSRRAVQSVRCARARGRLSADFARARRCRKRLGDMHLRDGEGDLDATLCAVRRDVRGLSAEPAAPIDESTTLFGAMPELDSMAVPGLLTEIED